MSCLAHVNAPRFKLHALSQDGNTTTEFAATDSVPVLVELARRCGAEGKIPVLYEKLPKGKY